MAAKRTPIRVFLLLSIIALVGALFPIPSDAVTKSQVDQACASSQAQLADYRAAQKEFEDAAIAYEAALNDVAQLEQKQGRIQASVDSQSETLAQVQDQLEEQAVQMYMMGGFNNPGIIFSASSVDQVMTTEEFLNSATLGGQESINDLIASKNQLSQFQDDLDVVHDELKTAEASALDLLNQQEESMKAEQAAYAKLNATCKDLTTKYNKEQALLAARRNGSIQVGDFICPITPGKTSFIDSWGYPRSGGRKHKGTDMFASRGEPVYAVQAGTASASNNSLGGITVHLRSGGITYYYAHLDSRTFSGTISVGQGETLGYVGNTGNAAHTSPHLHFEIRPGGVPVNPYPTLRAACY